MNKQLYKFIPDIEYPSIEVINKNSGEVVTYSNIQPGYFSMYWPNDFPCTLVEMFLQDKSNEVKVSKKDGGTIKGYASNLSHLIRFCYERQIEFWDLHHSDIDDFVFLISNETNYNNERLRENDTVNTIISSTVQFLEWLQTNICTDKRIIGVDNATNRYQIKLINGKYSTRRGKEISYTKFPSKVPDSTKNIKKPMPTSIKNELWKTLSSTKHELQCSNKLIGKFTKKEQNDHIEYMYNRRELQLILLENTGLRPQELITIKASTNIKHIQNCKIEIPTLKRREKREKTRIIPIDRFIAMKLELFIIKHRTLLIKRLIRSGIAKSREDIDDVIYLNAETGKEVKPDAAYQEFRRLTVKAGISQKSCQSMFRHRFVTNMVKMHLISFIDKSGLKSRSMVTESDIRTILKKVASFTGHKDPNSLMHYIDLAWEELNVFSYAYDVKKLQDKLKSIFYLVHSIKSDINSLNKKDISKNALETFNLKLQELESLTT